ncbi:hypothetical protein CISG_03861 [Coccidioides immitis RMSCC 3703]|uniref:Signal peptidase complex subunit 1 n=1 Tax=Coccidioides immitis RMSCC 3703 TaxID=454286 RepID=A0A0J8QRK0_COCIT|nr:hypothetical protein CISG_03861 [Coccidioides immitis RMSCC 3703]
MYSFLESILSFGITDARNGPATFSNFVASMKLGRNESYLARSSINSGHLSSWNIGCMGPWDLPAYKSEPGVRQFQHFHSAKFPTLKLSTLRANNRSPSFPPTLHAQSPRNSRSISQPFTGYAERQIDSHYYFKMDEILAPLQDIFEAQIDFHGQRLAEILSTVLLILFGAIGFIAGYIYQDIFITVLIGTVGLISTMLVVVPSWPIYNKHPEPWLVPGILRSARGRNCGRKR